MPTYENPVDGCLRYSERGENFITQSWEKVNGVSVFKIGGSPLKLEATHLLYVRIHPPMHGLDARNDERWVLWDKIAASSHQAAMQYFAGIYPKEERKVVTVQDGVDAPVSMLE